ncbi:hypothetical protein Tco_1239223, partial [Tanacetum coccineum]
MLQTFSPKDLMSQDLTSWWNNMDLRMDGSRASNFSHIWVFWQTAIVRTLANETLELVASIDNKEYTIIEASVRSKLQLADATGISNLPDAEIYDGLATLGFLQMILGITTENNGKYLAPTLTKKLFANMKRGYAGDYVPLLPAMLAGAAEDQGEGSAIPAEP